jgi:hypothetical protein
MAASKTGTAVETAKGPQISKVENLEASPYLPGQEEWDEVVAVAHQVVGHDLAKDELLDALVGVPFMVTGLTFRKGIQKAGVPYDCAMVSAEAVIAPEHVLKRRRVNMESFPFEPGSQIVFNDGSTGIYRQITNYLAMAGFITLPENLPENGAFGETRYDLPPAEWTEIHAGEIRFTDEGFAEYRANVRLTCPRGLRISEYVNDYNPSGSKTRYLA